MVISPAIMTNPVAVRVSQATRLMESSVEASVEDGVGNLIGDFIGMAFGHRSEVNKITIFRWQWFVSLRLHWTVGHRAIRYEPGFPRAKPTPFE